MKEIQSKQCDLVNKVVPLRAEPLPRRLGSEMDEKIHAEIEYRRANCLSIGKPRGMRAGNKSSPSDEFCDRREFPVLMKHFQATSS